MPKFQSREEYEKWKNEKMSASSQEAGGDLPPEPQMPLETTLEPHDAEDKKTGLYVKIGVPVLIIFTAFIIYKLFIQTETWTDTSYTNWKIGFTVDVPEYWDEYDFAFGEKALFNMSLPPGGKMLFALSPENKKDTVYALMYLDTEQLGGVENRLGQALKAMSSGLSSQRFDVEEIERNIGGMDVPFIQAFRDKETIILGYMVVPDALFFIELYDMSGKYEQEFWSSIGSFTFIE